MRTSVALAILGVLAFAVGLSLSQANLSPTAASPEPQTLDERFAELARDAPGFAGMFLGPDPETLNILLKDDTPDRRAAVERAVASYFDAEGRSLPPNLRVLPARYDFLELKQWYDLLSSIVLPMRGVVWTDIDEVKNAIGVGVDGDDTRVEVEEGLAQLQIRDGLVEIQVVERVLEESSLRDYHRPLIGGLQISGEVGTCTLGFVADREDTRGFVTAHHCSLQIGAVDGMAYYQPSSPPTSNLAGVETVDPPFFTGSPCPSERRCRYSQASFVSIAGGVMSTRGQIARPPLGSYSWDGTSVFGVAADRPSVLVGDPVTKVGRTTGRTAGTVTATCRSVNLADGRTYICQQVADYSSSGGDSGSPVFRIIDWPSPNDVTLYGMHWGASGSDRYYSGMAEIERSDELGPVDTCAYGLSC